MALWFVIISVITCYGRNRVYPSSYCNRAMDSVGLSVPFCCHLAEGTYAFYIIMVYVDGVAAVEKVAVSAIVTIDQAAERIEDKVETFRTGRL